MGRMIYHFSHPTSTLQQNEVDTPTFQTKDGGGRSDAEIGFH